MIALRDDAATAWILQADPRLLTSPDCFPASAALIGDFERAQQVFPSMFSAHMIRSSACLTSTRAVRAIINSCVAPVNQHYVLLLPVVPPAWWYGHRCLFCSRCFRIQRRYPVFVVSHVQDDHVHFLRHVDGLCRLEEFHQVFNALVILKWSVSRQLPTGIGGLESIADWLNNAAIAAPWHSRLAIILCMCLKRATRASTANISILVMEMEMDSHGGLEVTISRHIHDVAVGRHPITFTGEYVILQADVHIVRLRVDTRPRAAAPELCLETLDVSSPCQLCCCASCSIAMRTVAASPR